MDNVTHIKISAMKPNAVKVNPVEKYLMIGIICLVVYVLFRIVPADVILISGIIIVLSVTILRIKWMKLKEKGTVLM